MQQVYENRRRLKIGLNLAVIIVSLISITGRKMTFEKASYFEELMVDSFAPVQRSVAFMKRQFTSFFQDYVANISASKNNAFLQRKVHELESHIFTLSEVARENKRLKDLLDFKGEVQAKKILAQIVAWDSNSSLSVIRVNKGATNGVRLQSTVVTAKGLVGYVYRLTDHFADILTILDPRNRIDAIVQRIRAHGIIEGFNLDKTIMKYVTRTEPVILNDVVITSGLGNIYPKGLMVGNISRIERESFGITQDIEVAPSVNFHQLEEVIILITEFDENKQKELDALNSQEDEGSK